MTAVNVSRPAALVRLADGASVRLRAAEPEDAAQLRQMFFGLSERTRYLYFMAGVPPIEKFAERVVVLGIADGQSAYALVAEAENTVIGVARFDCAPDGTAAEVGILLTDAWQSRGLGRLVLDRLADVARDRAVCALTAHVLWENTRMLRLARRAFPHMRMDCGWGECELTMLLESETQAQAQAQAQAPSVHSQSAPGCDCGDGTSAA